MQTRFLKILLLLLFPVFCWAQPINRKIIRADSLFRAKQYTQSFALYQSVLAEKHYSSSMLLKMAYIQEGLGHLGLCLYYINLYHKASDDSQVLSKMEELAQKYQLEGYQSSDSLIAQDFLQKKNPLILTLVGSLVLLSLAILIYQKRRKGNVMPALIGVAFFLAALFFIGNWGGQPATAIISSQQTYIMSDPSAGASVVGIVGEGHRVTLYNKKDVWLKIKWHERDAYIKENTIMPITL